MELIKKLGMQFYGEYKRSFGVFLCPLCGETVERRLDAGNKSKSCGCDNGWHWFQIERKRRLWEVWKEQGLWKVQFPKGRIGFKLKKEANE